MRTDHPSYSCRVQVRSSATTRYVSFSTPPVLSLTPRSVLGSPNYAQYVSREQAERVAQAIGARAYKECSALKIEGVDDVFEAATRASMLMREGVPAHQRRRSSVSRTGEETHEGKCCIIC